MNTDKPVDLVLVSAATTDALRQLTRNAIDTAGPRANIIVVESNRQVSYPGATVVYPDAPFNYNAYLNLGARRGKAEYIFFGNNDLVFTDGWDAELTGALETHGADSASPLCPRSHASAGIRPNEGVLFGESIFSRFCGWAFLWKRQLYDELNGLDEDFTFWCSDNAAAEQLIRHHKKHLLVTSSIVHHWNEGNNTIKLQDKDTVRKYTVGEIEKYNQKFDQTLRVEDDWKIPEGQ